MNLQTCDLMCCRYTTRPYVYVLDFQNISFSHSLLAVLHATHCMQSQQQLFIASMNRKKKKQEKHQIENKRTTTQHYQIKQKQKQSHNLSK